MFQMPPPNPGNLGSSAAAAEGALAKPEAMATSTASSAAPPAFTGAPTGTGVASMSQTKMSMNPGGMMNPNNNTSPEAIANRAMMLQAQFQHLMFLQKCGSNLGGAVNSRAAGSFPPQNPNIKAPYPLDSRADNSMSSNKRPWPETSSSRFDAATQNKRPKVEAATAPSPGNGPPLKFINQRISRLFRVRSTNRRHQDGFVRKLFFGTVVGQELCHNKPESSDTEKAVATSAENVQSTAAKNERDVEYTWHILYDDGDEADFCFTTVEEARKLYLENAAFDRRKILITRSDTDDEYQENDHNDDDEEEEEEEFVPTASTEPPTKKQRGRQPKKPKGVASMAASQQGDATPTSASNTSASKNPAESQPTGGGRKKPQVVWSGPPDDPMEGGWPDGWVKRIVKRMNSSKKHTDPYWYSPQEQYKLRSMREVGRFMDALKQENGDEKEAWKRFKGKK